MENNYQNPPAKQPAAQQQFAKRYEKERAVPPQKPSMARTVWTILALILFFALGLVGVLIAQKQYLSKAPVAPNAPQSEPKANIVQEADCTLTFTVPEPVQPSECGYSPCTTNDDCADDLICVAASDGENYCAKADYEEACANDPTVANCCEAPIPEPSECGATPCSTDDDCADDLICITASDDNNYCAKADYEEACTNDPTVANCCEAPAPEPSECGYSPCTSNDDCSGELVCITANNDEKYCAKTDYEEACANDPTVANCCEEPGASPTPTPTPTPTSPVTVTTAASTSGQPEYPNELWQTGPADWLNYLQIGLASLGVGALLLLLL